MVIRQVSISEYNVQQVQVNWIDREVGKLSKPTFYQLRSLHGGGILEIAHVSGVDPLTVWSVLTEREVEMIDAHMILCGFNELCGTHYTLNDVDVMLKRKYVASIAS
jgi:hypothetical protein